MLRGLAIYQLDLAAGRSFSLTETLKLTLKAEAFNIFNLSIAGVVAQTDSNQTNKSDSKSALLKDGLSKE